MKRRSRQHGGLGEEQSNIAVSSADARPESRSITWRGGITILTSTGKQRQLYGYGISAKRYPLYARDGLKVQLIKASEHGLGLYYRPKEGRDSDCDVPLWIKEGWQWLLNRALGLPCQA